MGNVWGYWSDLSNCKNSCMDSFNSYKDSYMNNLNNYKENINSYRNEAFEQAKDMGSQWVNQAKQRLEGQAEVVRDQVEQLGQLLLEKEFTQQSLLKFCSISQNICDTIHRIELENNTNTLARYLNTPQLKVLLQLVKHHLEWSNNKVGTFVTYKTDDMPNAMEKVKNDEEDNIDSGRGSVFSTDSDDLLAERSAEESERSMEESNSESGSLNSPPIGGERKSKKRMSFFSKKKSKKNSEGSSNK